MFKCLQVVGAVLLLVLSSSIGQAGLLQCLCTGQVSFAPSSFDECTDCCDKEHGDQQPRDEIPSPCDDGSCFLLITLDVVDPLVTSVSNTDPVASCPPASAASDLVAPRDLCAWQPLPYRPPDRQHVPLTVLFSSFLI